MKKREITITEGVFADVKACVYNVGVRIDVFKTGKEADVVLTPEKARELARWIAAFADIAEQEASDE